MLSISQEDYHIITSPAKVCLRCKRQQYPVNNMISGTKQQRNQITTHIYIQFCHLLSLLTE